MGTKHRRRGMGSIFKHGTSWYIAFYDHGKQVKEKVGPIGLITKGQAEEALKARMGEVVQGRFNLEKMKQPVSFNKLAEDYLKWSEDNHKSPERDSGVVKHLLRYFNGIDLSDVTTWLFEKYKSERKPQVKPATLNRELSVAKRMFNLGIQWGMTTVNPLIGVKFLPMLKGIPKALKGWEFVNLYNAASSHLKPILLCAYLTGMRRGEIVKLKWTDVDFETDTLFVRESKNNESRAIPMNAMLRSGLQKMKEASASDYVFTTPNGTQYKHKDAFKTAWYTALRKSGIDKCRFHDHRHTFITNLIVDQKEDLITVSELSGHKDMRMLKRYGHSNEEHKKEAIQKLGVDLNLTEKGSNNHTTITQFPNSRNNIIK